MLQKTIDKYSNGGYDSDRRLRMRDIYTTLTEKRRELQRLQREVEALELAARILGDEKKLSVGAPQSQPQMALAILQANGKPMHVKQIAEQIKKRFGKAVKKTNLGVLLFRYAQRVKHFYKVQGKPNTYGLLEWKPTMGQSGESRVVQ